MKNNTLKVGDKIMDNGQVQRVYEIKTREKNGETVKIALFRPYYKKGKDTTVLSSVPVKNFNEANIRKPMDKSTLKDVRAVLKDGVENSELELKDLKEKMNENDPFETATVAKYLWIEKKDREKLPPSKKKIYKKALRALSEEFAYAMGKRPEKAKASVKRALSS
jgi:RNA polymerase-interacting CarD/CdnL/TRCF family regulator